MRWRPALWHSGGPYSIGNAVAVTPAVTRSGAQGAGGRGTYGVLVEEEEIARTPAQPEEALFDLAELQWARLALWRRRRRTPKRTLAHTAAHGPERNASRSLWPDRRGDVRASKGDLEARNERYSAK